MKTLQAKEGMLPHFPQEAAQEHPRWRTIPSRHFQGIPNLNNIRPTSRLLCSRSKCPEKASSLTELHLTSHLFACSLVFWDSLTASLRLAWELIALHGPIWLGIHGSSPASASVSQNGYWYFNCTAYCLIWFIKHSLTFSLVFQIISYIFITGIFEIFAR